MMFDIFIERTSDDIPPVGFDNETGYGKVNAYRALALLDIPNVLYHGLSYGGTTALTNINQWIYTGGGRWGLASGTYLNVDKYVVTKHINFDVPFCSIPSVWLRERESAGLSQANPNGGYPYAEITNVTKTGFDVKYSTYYVRTNLLGQTINKWIPAAVASTKIAYTAIGEPNLAGATGPITGPSLICSSGATFTITNLPSTCSVLWGQSSNLTLSSAAGNSATFTANGNGSGSVSATINSGLCQVVLDPKPVWVGAPNNLSISGSTSIKKGIIKTWSIQNAATQNVTGYSWYTDGGIIPIGSTTASTFQAKGVGCGLDVISCELTNACGTGSNPCFLDVDVICIKPAGNISIIVYPQPANNTLNVELVDDSIGVAGNPATFPEYELRLLNRNSNVLLTEKINSKFKTIDISKLRSGAYILQIINGEFIASRTIIISK